MNADQLRTAAESWRGTPFFPHGRVKGERGGVSCQTFVASLYIEAGVLPEGFNIPEAPLQTSYDTMLYFIGTLLQFERVYDAPQPGDLLLFKIHRSGHLAVALDREEMAHCLRPQGVMVSRIDDATFMKRLTHVWRPI